MMMVNQKPRIKIDFRLSGNVFEIKFSICGLLISEIYWFFAYSFVKIKESLRQWLVTTRLTVLSCKSMNQLSSMLIKNYAIFLQYKLFNIFVNIFNFKFNLQGAGTFTSLPDILYSSLSISSGFLIFLLPETNNEPFTDTLKQAENIGR